MESQTQLHRQVQILTRLAEVSVTLSSTLRLRPLLKLITEIATDIVDAESASVLLWNPRTQELRFMAIPETDKKEDLMVGQPIPLSSIAGTALVENRVVAVNNVAMDPRFYAKVDETTAFRTKSVLALPMRYKNRSIGILEAVNKNNGDWTPDDIHYLSILASQAAVAIEVSLLLSTLQKVNDELSTLDKMKNEFISIASHELRTPLSVILGYAGFLQEIGDEEYASHAETILASANQLGRIIESLTNLNHLETSEIKIKPRPTNLEAFIRQVVDDIDIRHSVESKHHHLLVLPPPQDTFVNIDRERMQIAITNILNNAIRFTPDNGRINVRVEVPNGAEAWILISDNGIGLAEENLERIFQRFVQVEDHMTRHHGGLGIGLSISKAVVEGHGGKIWAQSAGLNKGSVFTIAIPLMKKPPSNG